MGRWIKRLSRGLHIRPTPVLLASLFFALSVVCVLQDQLSPARQAKEAVEALFTVSQERDFDRMLAEGTDLLYEERFRGRTTEAGMESAKESGMPFTLLFIVPDFRLDHTYVKKVELSPIEGGEEEGTLRFGYRAEIDYYLKKGDLLLAPVEEHVFGGFIVMRRTGPLSWKMEETSGGELPMEEGEAQ